MSRRTMRPMVAAAAVAVALASAPATARAQNELLFTSCTTAGLCGWVSAVFQGSILTVKMANTDNSLGSAMFTANLFFASALNPAALGKAFQANTTFYTQGPVASIGTVSPWTFSGVGGSNELDLATFGGSNIEGLAESPFRSLPGDLDAGTWVTGKKGFVGFTADLSGVAGLDPNGLVGLGFCTDRANASGEIVEECASGTPVATPEPATIGLVATGLVGLGLIRRRRKVTA